MSVGRSSGDKNHISRGSVQICRQEGEAMSYYVEDNMYVLFIKSGKENIAVAEIKGCISSKEIVPINYSVEYIFRKHGREYREYKPLFPGYLLVRSQLGDHEFVMATYDCIHKSNNIIRLLRYNEDMISLRKEEKSYIEDLLQGEEYIKSSSGYIQGDKVVITNGPFVGKESVIKSINRHKRQAVIEISIMGEVRRVIIGLEILRRALDM